MILNYKMIYPSNSKTLSNIVRNDRLIWTWLNTVFNRPDPQRIEAVGPEVAAAEWLLKNGASVKWTDSREWINNYNSLPNQMDKQKKIKEIDATNSSISSIGFPHIKGLTKLDKIVFNNNGYIDDNAIEMLDICKNSLRHLEIISCIGVTDRGVLSLIQLKNLNYLKLFDLPSVEDRDNCLSQLKTGLNCDIDWKTTKPKKLI